MKILIVGPSWVGDMVMSQSLYKSLKELYPDAIIHVLAPAWCKPILARMKEVDSSIEMPLGHGDIHLKERFRIGRQLSSEGYTHSFVLPNSAKSALIPFIAKIPKRTGWKGEFRYGLLNDLRPNKKVFQYMVERYVALAYECNQMLSKVKIDQCPSPELKINQKSQAQACSRLELDLNKPAWGICPGAEFGPAKRWPEMHYAKVAQHIIENGGQVWTFGSQKDRVVTQAIRNLIPENLRQDCIDLAGETSLTEVIDLLALCRAVITNDSGLMHVSAAVGTHVIALYGSSSPSYTPPLTKKLNIVHNNVECRPCFKRECPLGHMDCLNKLSPNNIIEILNVNY
ncbi:lipopolysaccharide heptosyltransferase II [uncultured Vibrio sp.]|mgnify:CR=1 FL=1|uniref:lipopolysaccharide heptosyltransferase II n=1 Tax=uncultured Vibrio sp. TaxID=114054 RepID=UPI0025D0B7BF|nr:lipopolysaccharide heptosyltransferase II [uncultured Vibrio sp.]